MTHWWQVLTDNVCGGLQARYTSRRAEDDSKHPCHNHDANIGHAQAVALLTTHQHQPYPAQQHTSQIGMQPLPCRSCEHVLHTYITDTGCRQHAQTSSSPDSS